LFQEKWQSGKADLGLPFLLESVSAVAVGHLGYSNMDKISDITVLSGQG